MRPSGERADSVRADVKACTRCGRTFPKTPEHFYGKGGGSRLRSDCKECFNRRVAESAKRRRSRLPKPAVRYADHRSLEACFDSIIEDIEATPGEGERYREVMKHHYS